MHKKILIMGNSGSGKTTLASALAPLLNAVVFNNDDVRTHINQDLGFSEADRIQQATRMGWLCDQVVKSGNFAIADFICPTPETRAAFTKGGEAFIVWVNRIKDGPFPDTNKIFIPPESCDLEIPDFGLTPISWAKLITRMVQPVFNPKSGTALFVGRFQPFHDGHRKLIIGGIKRVGQVCIAVRDTHKAGDKENPYSFEEVRQLIETGLREYSGRFIVIQVPNITNIFYGRKVGYNIERIYLDEATHAISATEIRRKIGV